MWVANPATIASGSHERSAALMWPLALAPPIVLVAAAAAQPFIDPRLLFIDPVAGAEQAVPCCRVALGLMSNLGVAVMATGFGFMLLAAAAIDSTSRARGAMGLAAVLTALISMDDLLLLHERVLPSAGVPELAVEAVYCLCGAVLVLAHRAWMPAGAFAMLLISMALLGSSVGLDMALEIAAAWASIELQARLLTPTSASAVTVIEDGAKFIGYWLWAYCHFTAARIGDRAAAL